MDLWFLDTQAMILKSLHHKEKEVNNRFHPCTTMKLIYSTTNNYWAYIISAAILNTVYVYKRRLHSWSLYSNDTQQIVHQ